MSAAGTAKGARIVWLRTNNPDEWREAVRKALEQAGTRGVIGAAEILGVSSRNVQRWVAEDPSLKKKLNLPGRGRPPVKKAR